MLKLTCRYLEKAKQYLDRFQVKSALVSRDMEVREELDNASTMLCVAIERLASFERIASLRAQPTDILVAKPGYREVLADSTNLRRPDDLKQEVPIFDPSPTAAEGQPSFARSNNFASRERMLAPSLNRRPVTRASKQAEIKEFKQEIEGLFGGIDNENGSLSAYNSSSGPEELGSSNSRQGSSRRVRGPYRKYDEATKRAAIAMAKQVGNDYATVSKKLRIPAKNIKRWIASGAVRKKGGRKTQDPKMESNLNNWIQGYIATYKKMPSSREIKLKAMDFSSKAMPFKASKGWLEKFLARHGYTKNKAIYREPIASARIDTADIFVKSEEPYDYHHKEEINEFDMDDYHGF